MLGVITSIFSVLAGLLFMGNMRWSSKEDMFEIKTQVAVMATDVKAIKKFFDDAVETEVNKRTR